MTYWQGKRVCVTGGAGFLGTNVVRELHERGVATDAVFAPRSAEYDLRTREGILACLEAASPDVVIHLAAVVGGIGANRANPGKFLYDNLMMATQLIEECRLQGIDKFVGIGTVCAYPKFAPVPFKEDDLWDGYPEETNAPYGLAKKMMLAQLQAYRQQYGLNGIFLIPVNLYGPGDNFDLETSHVIPAMIRKMVAARDAGDDEVVLWGTGTPTREFLYVDDCARGIVAGAERYEGPEPVNLGTGREIAIRDLAELIGGAVGWSGEIVWDVSEPDGQPRRMLDVTRARELFGWQAQVDLEEGIRRTVQWWEEHRPEAHDAG